MKQFLFSILLSTILFACKQDERPLFNAKGLHVVTVFANRMQKTMSVLYGNNDGKYTLVTYNQANNKYWYGSYINGTIKRVETIDGGQYELEQGAPLTDSVGNVVSNEDRMKDILSHRPAILP